ncbi:MAG TPA: hypothetical protein VGX25_13330 [Actinophytocola sp.]|uniref:hypothetical protein n=1 Tax=Actinophytocola sp. TaxID=1872138 RepID=UPI002DDD6249|nr:hypothetical protein [Actinophytocola sp.]HEV2780367.1 hypothetical protein [Actinophytocola sp.]
MTVLVGAGLALLAQIAVQLFVVPHVEARKRREDRWERDVLALGELLSAELPDRAAAARRDQSLLNAVHRRLESATEVDAERREELIRELELKANESVARYKALALTRIDWLANRIRDIDANNARLQEFFILAEKYGLHGRFCTLWVPAGKSYNDDVFHKAWNLERELAEKLYEFVNAFARCRVPRKASWLRRWLRASSVRKAGLWLLIHTRGRPGKDGTP